MTHNHPHSYAMILNFQVVLQMANKRYPGRFGLSYAPYVPVPLAFAVKKGGSAARLAGKWLRD